MTSNRDAPQPLTLDQTKAFEDILAVFDSPGWKHLAQRLELDAVAAGDVRNCKDLAFTQGQLSVLDNIRAWPQTWAAVYDAVKNGDAEVEPDAFK